MKTPRLLICALSAVTLQGCAVDLEPAAQDYPRQSGIRQNEDAKAVAATRAPSSAAAKPARAEISGPRQRFSTPAIGVLSDRGHTLASSVAELIEPSTSEVAPNSASALVRNEDVGSKVVTGELRADRAASTYDSKALLFALMLGVAAIVAGAFVYRNRRPSWLKQRMAIGGLVVSSAAVAAFALYLWADMKKVPQRDLSAQPESAASKIDGKRTPSGVGARSASLVGTYVCGEAKPGEKHTTHTVMTRKYYSDGVYVDMAQTWSNSIPTMFAIRIGTFEWASDSRLILRQLAASPNIEAREPIVKTDVLVEQQVSDDLTGQYSSRVIRRSVSGQPQTIANVTEHCRVNEEASTTMDELRAALKQLLPLDKR